MSIDMITNGGKQIQTIWSARLGAWLERI